MKKVLIAAALMLLSSQALAETEKEFIIAGSGTTQRAAKMEALDTADKYCQKKFNLRAKITDYVEHPLSSKEVYMLLLSYICTENGTKK
ncbi:MAG: hypothetical protein OQJ97_16575 [Rhodospirillales bacterium]|nr:hypothetical protein [Rhodospirillales bacterium]